MVIIGIDVFRGWLDGFSRPGKQRFRFQNSPDGHARLLKTLQSMSDGFKVRFEATGGQKWALWRVLISMGINTIFPNDAAIICLVGALNAGAER